LCVASSFLTPPKAPIDTASVALDGFCQKAGPLRFAAPISMT